MSEIKFLHCEECGNVAALLTDGGGEMVCCDQPMIKLEADTVDAAKEKHVPEPTRDGNDLSVVVGSTIHPMVEKHYITFIATVQGDKLQVNQLKPGEEPKADFKIEDGPVDIYEFCNLHGLWKSQA